MSGVKYIEWEEVGRNKVPQMLRKDLIRSTAEELLNGQALWHLKAFCRAAESIWDERGYSLPMPDWSDFLSIPYGKMRRGEVGQVVQRHPISNFESVRFGLLPFPDPLPPPLEWA